MNQKENNNFFTRKNNLDILNERRVLFEYRKSFVIDIVVLSLCLMLRLLQYTIIFFTIYYLLGELISFFFEENYSFFFLIYLFMLSNVSAFFVLGLGSIINYIEQNRLWGILKVIIVSLIFLYIIYRFFLYLTSLFKT